MITMFINIKMLNNFGRLLKKIYTKTDFRNHVIVYYDYVRMVRFFNIQYKVFLFLNNNFLINQQLLYFLNKIENFNVKLKLG